MIRRDLLKAGTLLGLAAACRIVRAEPAAKPLRLLVLGGTRFIGPHFIAAARARGHTVTIFNRGRTNVGRVKDVEVLNGDRDGKLDALKGRRWDAVLDTSGYVPRIVRLSAELLADAVAQYVFVSSVSVYASFAKPNTEGSPLAHIADASIEKVDGETYGALKALSELAADKAMPGRVTVVRPGLIVGPEDNTDRFTYWPARFARGGEVLAPNTPDDGIQIIDVRDLAAFMLLAIEQRKLGTYNVVSAPGQFTMGTLIGACRVAVPGNTTVTWVPASFLEEQHVEGWSDMPVWVHATGDEAAFAGTAAAKALAAGLNIRPLAETVRDTLVWHRTRPSEQQATLKAGLSPEREREVLAAWHAHEAAPQKTNEKTDDEKDQKTGS
jgi:2'-hydroxyisoflavone reductase